MQEYEIYLPTTHNDGTAVPSEAISNIKKQLVRAFGGYTHLTHRNEGAWRMGGVTFRDDVTIIRVLDDGAADFDMAEFKRRLEVQLQQDTVLIVRREVERL